MTITNMTIDERLNEERTPDVEPLFDIPGNWKWVKLGSLCDISTGKLNANAAVVDGEYAFFTCAKEVSRTDTYAFDNEAILIAGNGLFNVKYYMGKFNAYQRTYVLENFKAHAKYLYYYIDNTLDILTKNNRGSTIKYIRMGDLTDHPVCLPPYDEQVRIAEKIERLVAKIGEAKRQAEEVRVAYEKRLEAMLAKAFRGELTAKWRVENHGEELAGSTYEKSKSAQIAKKGSKKTTQFEPVESPIKLPDGWKWVRMGEVVDVQPPKLKLADVPDDQLCSFVPMSAVSDQTGEITDPEERAFAKVKKGYTSFQEGDVLFAKITPCMENGKAAVARGLKNGFGYGSTEFYVLRCSKYVDNEFVYYLVRSQTFRRQAKRVMTGAVGQQRVPKDFLKQYPLPLPPLPEQREIVRAIKRLTQKENIVKRTVEMDSLFNRLTKSLLFKAFRGRL